MESKYTKGEWKLDSTFYHIENTCVTDSNGNTIAECHRNAYHKDREIAEANAKRIVTAVNSYDALWGALADLHNLVMQSNDRTIFDNGSNAEIVANAKMVLLKAKHP